ncbi:MAG: hypothetical protein QOJ03_2840, partial [Frankiaceae bacterium]|nr:hypothetical protein [Frankiaceae bacterium]
MLDVRRLADDDFAAAWRLGRLAFGGPPGEPDPASRPRPDDGLHRWGGFDGPGRLVAKATDIEHGQWWGGRLVAASGVAGVAVEPEQRGRGATRAVMTALLDGARERGAAVAALFCTSTAVYRSVGFETCGVLRHVDIPTAHLRRAATPSVRLRAGDGTDWPAVRAVYGEVARTGNGLLSRRGPTFPDPTDAALPDGIDGVSLAEDEQGRVVGYATWQRGRGYGDSSAVTVHDCLALTSSAADALLGSIGTWVTVAPTVRFRLPPWADAVTTQLPLERAREHRAEVWMHRPIDVVAAVAARGWPAAVTGSVDFRLHDPLLPWNDGEWRLSLSAGEGRLEPAAADTDLTLSVRGWSLLWCGAARAAQVRQAGFLTGGDTAADDRLDATLGSGGPAALLDYFSRLDCTSEGCRPRLAAEEGQEWSGALRSRVARRCSRPRRRLHAHCRLTNQGPCAAGDNSRVTTYLVTGGTGFLGRHLVERLLSRSDARVVLLVRRGSMGKLEALAAGWPTDGRLEPLAGDLTDPLLGVSPEDRDRLRECVDHVVHLAALYDMTADAETNRRVNIGGTQEAIALAADLCAGCFHHVSSVAVAGDHQGSYTESMFDVGQRLPSPYHATKFEAERIVREQTEVPWRVYRPAIVVGHSTTGEMDKIDGPYYFFPALARLAELPSWLPIVAPDLGDTNVVPVDFVAAAMDVLIHRPGIDGRAFHLVSPEPQRLLDVVNAFSRAAGAPPVAVPIDRRVVAPISRVLRLAGRLPGATVARDVLLDRLAVPPEVVPHMTFRSVFDAAQAQEQLVGSGVLLPPLDDYAEVLWRHWEQHLDPARARRPRAGGALDGRTVVITGASSGIGRATALTVASRGGVPLLVARSADKLDEVRAEIEVAGGTAHVYPCDITDTEAVAATVKEMVANHP